MTRGSKACQLMRVTLAASLLLLGACSDHAPSLPSTAAVMELTLSEYRIAVQGHLRAGRTVFRLINTGRQNHRPSLLNLSDDIPPIAEQVRGKERRFLPPLAGLNDQPPGARGTFAVDLFAGQRYAFICFALAPDGVSHAVKGMTWEARTPR